MRAFAGFTDPSDIPVTITLTGRLTEFEALRKSLTGDAVPFHQVQALVGKIDEASRKLRAQTSSDVED